MTKGTKSPRKVEPHCQVLPDRSCISDNVETPLQLLGYGPTLKVSIGWDRNYTENAWADPVLQRSNVLGLLSTGTLDNLVDEHLARELKLPLEKSIQIRGAQCLNYYGAHIHIPALKLTMDTLCLGQSLSGGRLPYAVAFGRIFLRHCVFSYNGVTGEAEIALADGYRQPRMRENDRHTLIPT
jgi:hypothetical protein